MALLGYSTMQFLILLCELFITILLHTQRAAGTLSEVKRIFEDELPVA